MIIKRFFKQIPLLIAFLALISIATFWSIPTQAQTSDIGAGGASNIIGLPSSGSHFQNAASQAQSGSFSNPVGGSNLLQEDKTALIIVDAPAYTGSSVEPKVSSANVWWVYILIFIALISLIGIALVFWANKYGQDDELADADEEDVSSEEADEDTIVTESTAAEETISELEARIEAKQIITEATESAGIQVVDFEEEPPEPAKTSKKRKHGGRPVKKSRK